MPTDPPLRVGFLVNDLSLSGGVGVVVEYARHLAALPDMTAALILVRELEEDAWRYAALGDVEVLDVEQARERDWDVLVSTWWETALRLFDLPAERYVSFVQSLEDRFYVPGKPERLGAALALDLPVSFITEATWIRDTLADLRPGAPCRLVRNGIDKSVYAPLDAVPDDAGGPLRVLIEGNPRVWFKGVPAAAEAAAAMRLPHVTTLVTANPADAGRVPVDHVVGPLTPPEMADLYARHDVLLKLSRVEGMFGPPLEAFHRGATCVVTEVTGYDEYVRHLENGLVVDWDDPHGTARALDLLAHDRALLRRLRQGALATARAWPSWDDQAPLMADALREIAAEPPPAAAAAAGALGADVLAALETYRLQLDEREELAARVRRFERAKGLPGLAPVVRQWERPGVQRHVAPRVISSLKRLSGGS